MRAAAQRGHQALGIQLESHDPRYCGQVAAALNRHFVTPSPEGGRAISSIRFSPAFAGVTACGVGVVNHFNFIEFGPSGWFAWG